MVQWLKCYAIISMTQNCLNPKIFRIFTPSEIEEIRRITLWDIIVNATSIKPDEIQKHVFFWMDSDPCPQPHQLNSSNMPECNLMQQQDAFQVKNFMIVQVNIFIQLNSTSCTIFTTLLSRPLFHFREVKRLTFTPWF